MAQPPTSPTGRRPEGSNMQAIAHNTIEYRRVRSAFLGEEPLGGDYPSIIQQCYNARRDLPRALGEWMATGAGLYKHQGFLHRMQIAMRLMRGFTPEQALRCRFYAALKVSP